ncbi:alpha/beta fold hydrolase [Sphingomonas sp. UYP23]
MLAGRVADAAGWEPGLRVREQVCASGDRSRPVLYIHGATFPSDLSVFFRFDDRSWADNLNEAGFTVFGLDFAGYGGSERYASMEAGSSRSGLPEGRSVVADRQVARTVDLILASTGAKRVSIISHSWGTIVAGRFAARRPELVDRLVLFGAIAGRFEGREPVSTAWDLVTIEQQHARFVKDVPPTHSPVLLQHEFGRWAQAYLESDSGGPSRHPPSVAIPSGPACDIAETWSGRFPYDMSGITAPVLLMRGEWDSSSTARDARWLREQLVRAASIRDVVVPKATHLMHLEVGRTTLYAATNAFLADPDGRR